MPGLNASWARLREFADALASVVFAAPCRICGQPLDHASRIPICSPCRSSLTPLTDPMCARCGRPLVSLVTVESTPLPLCHVCRRGLYDFDFARSYGGYSPAMAAAIILLKYHQVAPLSGWFAGFLWDVVERHADEFRTSDVVVPVPQDAIRHKERGYNQAELIARPLARRLGLPCRSYLLMRTRPRPDKLRLTARERWRTVRGAYAIREGARVDKLRVLLVDDVFTTGATLDACSRALRRAGASNVVAVTVARAIPRREALGVEALPREPYE